MALIAWSIYDDTGAPLTGVVPTFVDYCDRAGVARAQPVILELGGGQYGFVPTDADVAVGVCYLVDNGATHEPARVSGPVTSPEMPFAVWHLEDDAGALWAGAAPTVASYVSSSGSRTAPAIVAARTYLFSLTPTVSDAAVGVSLSADSPDGAFPLFLQQTLVSLSPWAAPSPGPLKNPAADITAFLNGKLAGATTLTSGTNLFTGRMLDDTQSPAAAVFCLNTGGAAPVPYLNGNRTADFSPMVQVLVRGPVGDLAVGEGLARGVFAWLHQATVAGYVQVLARDSAPVLLEVDSAERGVWSINVECEYVASLG